MNYTTHIFVFFSFMIPSVRLSGNLFYLAIIFAAQTMYVQSKERMRKIDTS